ncbi:nicotinate phosphoribosyltransferase [Methyloligella sp. GL2]|nr:nicotinate phosphoribosyltransferase [Methyloligella sp. GL2]
MLQAYFDEALEHEAVFSLFVRRLPKTRNYLLACGQETVLDYLESLAFSDSDLAYLETLGLFSEPFLRHLADFRFRGDVYAIAEGTPVFANEPILEIVAPLPQAQLIETLVMNQINLATTLASKAVRVVDAADGRAVVDFAPRRMQGIDAALKAVPAFHVAGVAGTSNVLAGKLYGVPLSGTMAHSYIQAHDDEMEAFRAFTKIFPETILLVDTYDTLAGVDKVIALARELGEDFGVRAIRLDSGDLAELAKQARRRLDAAGLGQVEIFASGGLDEYAIAELVAAGAPIDGFGVGTAMGLSSDAPGLDLVYKLTSYAGEGRIKLATGKPVLPGRKQVFRIEEGGIARRDIIAREGETLGGQPLLEPVMRGGKRLNPALSLDRRRDYAAIECAKLPPALRGLEPADPPYTVEISPALQAYQDEIRNEIEEENAA